MKRAMVFALAASATLGLSATELTAQGNGRGNGQAQARAAQQARPAQARPAQSVQQQRDAERERLRLEREREAERERLRLERERQAAWERQARQQRDDRDRWDDRNRRDDRWDDRNPQARGGGPAFCRSGAGHPVHGRQWCRQKGFGLGNERWERARWEDVIFGQPRDRRRYDNGTTMSRGVLADVLGDVVLRRFEGYGSNYGRGNVTGNWLTGVDGRILQLSIGGVPFAQLVDSRGRGRADTVLLRR